MIDGALPNTINRFARTPDGKQLVITSFSDTLPAKWYLLDEEKKTMQELFEARPWIKPGQLVQQRIFRYRTRDGLEFPGYYFLPNGYKPGDKLPTVVHIHGGPSVRADTFGNGYGVFEAQILASRGYAVVLPNFRVTPGFGGKAYYAGFGQVGRKMIDDHDDAAKWAIEQGFADPARICISGASYGGYATLMALARYPATFRCGISGLMVSDLQLQVTSPAGDTAYSKAAVAYWNELVGAKSPSDYPRDVSPINLADRIKQPLLIYAGADDIRTPLEQTSAMISALQRSGNPPKKVIIKAGEGHGYGKVDNNVELYKEILDFLDATIGPKSAAR
jgi:dipeptidyl aminopeptidase/acylaminoacyl peptidase